MNKKDGMCSGGLTGSIYKPLSAEQVELIHSEALRLLGKGVHYGFGGYGRKQLYPSCCRHARAIARAILDKP